MANKPERRAPRSGAGVPATQGTPPPGAKPLPIARLELYATVFATGAAVMVVEILGTRIIAPVFGVNLFVWSALLAVTLCSLAIGYSAGGALVDRMPNVRLLSLVVLMAGVLVGLVMPLRHPVLGMAEGLGFRLGPLVSAAVLFVPSLIVLGMVGPIAVRLATDDYRTTGRQVGRIYAVSTAGSLVGTLVTAYVLIPSFETAQIVFGTAVLLAIIGATPLALRKSPMALLFLVVPVLPALTSRPVFPAGLDLVARTQSPYGLLEVINDNNRKVRLLRADHSVIGAIWLQDHSSGFGFLHLLESLRFMRPGATSMLQIGLGTGALPVALAPYGINADVVEIDPGVVRFAQEHFGFSTKGQIYVEDGRTGLRKLTPHSYDIVVHDTFTGGNTPEHLMSLEFLERVRSMMRPGGILALNFLGFQRGENAESSRAILRTLRAVFPVVRVFRDMELSELPDSISNIVFFASDASVDFEIPADAKFENDVCERILRNFRQWEILTLDSAGPIITDDLNPLARLQLAIASDHFSFMRQLLPDEVWLD